MILDFFVFFLLDDVFCINFCMSTYNVQNIHATLNYAFMYSNVPLKHFISLFQRQFFLFIFIMQTNNSDMY